MSVEKAWNGIGGVREGDDGNTEKKKGKKNVRGINILSLQSRIVSS